MVYIPPGTYVTGTLYLHSHGGLELDDHAILRASTSPDDYCCECDGVRLEDFTIEDTTGWVCFLYGCQFCPVPTAEAVGCAGGMPSATSQGAGGTPSATSRGAGGTPSATSRGAGGTPSATSKPASV